ncbi:hypothetical protein E2P81_ATG09428 [Venturia nashicola]|uniref:Uncharacterized protein n=1 Tax=Venturia nashicola TaxID=86259 RepID=A0A4Z1P897_9PEZI|nr:hypothetical protein E6O75_ATG09636 [Venturia nashicola]TLD25771.1 hypothetical protein E2P81_ATG09428 [Venturia nashicola]
MTPSINFPSEDAITPMGTDKTSTTISPRDRSTSCTASQHTHTSSSSKERKSRKHKKKPSGFMSFFAVKEPSAVAFQNLAHAMKEEITEKGTLPFGVPSGKIPASAESDYKKAKENAKEQARLYQEAKERQKKEQEHEKAMAKALMAHSKHPTIVVHKRTEEELLRNQLQDTAQAMTYISLDPRPSTSSEHASLPIPAPAHKKALSTSSSTHSHSRWKAPSLTSLPETTRSMSSAHSSPPPSMPATPSSMSRAPSAPSGARAEIAPWEVASVESAPMATSPSPKKSDVAPWEDDEEEEFPIRKGAKKSTNYFSTLIRR